MTKRGWVIHHDQSARELGLAGQSCARCSRFWGGVKNYHGQKFGAKWVATSLYSFGMCPHGKRFVGCGWDRNQAANGSDVVGPYDGRDSEWFTVLCFVGGTEGATPAMIDGLKGLIGEGRDSGRCARQVLPHNAFKVKACPGEHLTALATIWHNNPLYENKESWLMFNEAEATLHVYAAFREIAGRDPSPQDVHDWTAHLVHDGRNYFRLISLLSKEMRQRLEVSRG